LDSIENRIAQAKQISERSAARAAELEGESKALEASRAKATALEQQMADLTRAITELKATYELNRQVRGETFNLHESTRSAETKRDQIKANEEERKKTEQENKRRAQEADKRIEGGDINPDARRIRTKPNVTQVSDVPDVSEDFRAYHNDVVAQLNQLKQAIADSRNSLNDSANNV